MMKLIILYDIIYIYYYLSAAVTPAAGHYSSQVQNGVSFFLSGEGLFCFSGVSICKLLKAKEG